MAKPGEIHKNPTNPRLIKDDKYKKLVQSLKEFPEMATVRPVVVDENNVILGGNMRYQAMVDAGWDDIPVTQVKGWTKEQKKEFIIKDNLGYGEWDYNILANDYDLSELDDWGMDIPDDLMPVKEIEEDEAPEVDEVNEPISKLGEVYQLGRHRLMVGDSTKIEDVEKLMDGNKADMVFTDPPYGMDLDTDYSKLPSTKKEGNKTYSKVIGDDEEFDPRFILETFNYCDEIVMFGADYYADKLPKGGSWYVWDKRVDEKFDKMIGSAFELAWSKTKHKKEIARFNNTLFSGEKDARNKVHPTQKPLKLLTWFLDRLKGDVVLDLFGGSGSTLIACEQTDRTCYMMELSARYCDVIRKRYATLIGQEDNWQEVTSTTS